MYEYITASTENDYRFAGNLFREYAQWLKIDLSFQHFDKELQQLKKMYAPPLGTIIICKHIEGPVGCIAVRPIDQSIAELKRMYVNSEHQKRGIGQSLLTLSLTFAQKAGYAKIRLDTLKTMTPAITIYKKNGFKIIPPYYFNPETTAVYFEKTL